jgi:hypothetical protein
MPQMFTDENENGDSAVETVVGVNTVHVTGEFGCACLYLYGGPEGGDSTDFNKLRAIKFPQSFNLELAGDIFFRIEKANPSLTSISVSVEAL